MEEEHGGDEGYFSILDKVNKLNVQKRLKEIKDDSDSKDEIKVLNSYIKLSEQEGDANKKIKDVKAELEKKILDKYKSLSETEIKSLVVDAKWMTTMEQNIKTEMQRISQRLTQRIKELADRYQQTLSQLNEEVEEMEEKVKHHLSELGFVGF